MYLNEQELKELDNLIELFDENTALSVNFDDGRQLEWKVSCFKLLKEIVYGRIDKAKIAQKVIDDAKEQLTYAEEFLNGLGAADATAFEKFHAILK